MATHEEKELEGKPPLHEVRVEAEQELFHQGRVGARLEPVDEPERRQATSVPAPGSPAQPDEQSRASGSASANGGGVKIRLQFDLASSGGDVRASDEDRERAVRSLREHFAAGRLEEPDLEARLGRAYAAHSRRELAELLSDLPTDRLERAATRFYRGQRTALKYHALTYVTLNGSLAGIWELTGHPRGFWPALVLMPTSVVLAVHAAVSHWLRRTLRIGGDRTGAIR
jgi:hypothetical protein